MKLSLNYNFHWIGKFILTKFNTSYDLLRFQWQWFANFSLGRSTLSSIYVISYHLNNFKTRICLTHSQVKKHGMVSFQICVFYLFIIPTPYLQVDFQYIFHQFGSHFFSIESLSNYWIKYNWIGIELNSNLNSTHFKFCWSLLLICLKSLLLHWSFKIPWFEQRSFTHGQINKLKFKINSQYVWDNMFWTFELNLETKHERLWQNS
jgi:hypothetical protein